MKNSSKIPETLDDHMFYGLVLDEDQKHFRDSIWDKDNIVTICDSKAGSGKAQPLDTLIPTPNGLEYLGNLTVGDYVYDRLGNPTQILGIYPRGRQRAYRVTLSDGRSTICGPDHLWSYYNYYSTGFVTESLTKMLTRTVLTKSHRPSSRYRIPTNMPVKFPEKEYFIDPYVVGVFLGDGCCLERKLSLSNPDIDIVNEVARILNANAVRYSERNYTWNFRDGNENSMLKTKDIFKYYENYLMQYSYNKRIPAIYLQGSVEQRFSLLQGLMDTDGAITFSEGRYNVTYSTTSEDLMHDIRHLANSLGMSVGISVDKRTEKYTSKICFTINFRVPNDVKPLMFRKCKHKYELALDAASHAKQRNYSWVGIRSIEDLGYETEMMCIYVDNPEHLYLTNDFIVTHNTTIAVATANLLYEYGRYGGIVYIIFPTMEQKQGFIPGDPTEKNAPYRQPLDDALITLGLDPQTVIKGDNMQNIKNGRAYIDFISDTYLRGCNFENKVVIIDEFQNGYFDQCKKVLTRIHDSSKVIIIGHQLQCDIIKHPERAGFKRYLEAFREIEDDPRVSICKLTKNYRGWFSAFCDDVMMD